MKNIKSILGAVLMSLIFVVAASAGVLMVSTHESYNPKSLTTIKAYVSKDRMRVEVKGQDVDSAMIFRGDKQLFWSIDHKTKTYVETTKDDLRRMKEQMQSAMKQMEEQMKNLPPEQRKMMKQMMQGQFKQSSEKPTVTYKKVASGQVVNKWTCDKYEWYMEGKKVSDAWNTDWQKLGLSADDFKVMQDMAEFFKEFSEGIASSFYKVGKDEQGKEQGLKGVPVKEIHYSDGNVDGVTELKEVTRQDFAASLFEIPAGYKKEQMQHQK